MNQRRSSGFRKTFYRAARCVMSRQILIKPSRAGVQSTEDHYRRVSAFICESNSRTVGVSVVMSFRRSRLLTRRLFQHCVARYDWRCARRETSIWSLRQHGAVSVEHLLTITLDPKTLKIVCAKGRRNSAPTERGRELLELWAEREELQIDGQVLSV